MPVLQWEQRQVLDLQKQASAGGGVDLAAGLAGSGLLVWQPANIPTHRINVAMRFMLTPIPI